MSSLAPRKVLHVMNSASGGAAISTIGLIEALRGRGVESCVVCHNAGLPAELELLLEATHGETLFTPLYWWNKKIRASLWKRPLIELRQLLRTHWRAASTANVIEFARQHAVDLIHTNTILTPEGGLAARQLQIPHVWHVRELVGPRMPFQFYNHATRFREIVPRLANWVIANSHATAKQLRYWIPDDQLEVVPNGIDIQRFKPRAEGTTRDKLVIAMVGNLSSRTKKHELFIDVAASVDRSLPIEWKIYGDDPSRSGEIKGNSYIDRLHAKIARADLKSTIHFPGFVADPVEIMSDIDVLVHPADNESFGRVVVEAMASGLPVIGADGGGVAEIVLHNQTGLLGPPDDAVAIARHVERLVRDPQLRSEMGQAGRRLALERYSLEACANHVLRVYQSCFATQSRSNESPATVGERSAF